MSHQHRKRRCSKEDIPASPSAVTVIQHTHTIRPQSPSPEYCNKHSRPTTPDTNKQHCTADDNSPEEEWPPENRAHLRRSSSECKFDPRPRSRPHSPAEFAVVIRQSSPESRVHHHRPRTPIIEKIETQLVAECRKHKSRARPSDSPTPTRQPSPEMCGQRPRFCPPDYELQNPVMQTCPPCPPCPPSILVSKPAKRKHHSKCAVVEQRQSSTTVTCVHRAQMGPPPCPTPRSSGTSPCSSERSSREEMAACADEEQEPGISRSTATMSHPCRVPVPHTHAHRRFGHPEGYTCSHDRPFFIPPLISLQREDDKIAKVLAFGLLVVLLATIALLTVSPERDEDDDDGDDDDLNEDKGDTASDINDNVKGTEL